MGCRTGSRKIGARAKDQSESASPLAQPELDNTSEPALGRPWSGPKASDVMHNGVAGLVIAGIARSPWEGNAP